MSTSPIVRELKQWTAAELPDRSRTLEGSRVNLVPLDPDAHGDVLYDVSHDDRDPNLWKYLFYGPFPDRATFGEYLDRVAGSPSELFYTIVDAETGRPGGIASYLRMEPQHGCIEIGHIWFGVEMQRTPAATEAIFLLEKHVFDDLGYRRLEWKCDALNQRSRRAAIRFGFDFEGVFGQHMVIKGRNRDTAWYAILDGQWPVVKASFERWLAPENFDKSGAQRQSLSAVRDEIKQHVSQDRRDGQRSIPVSIRDAEPADEPRWRELWAAYNAFYEATIPPEVTASTWRRILDPSEPFGCLLAVKEGSVVGFANYVYSPYTWSERRQCLLEDLYVDADVRGGGTGRALIQALVERARAEGWTKVYWVTKEDNVRARRLYESLAPASGFIQYSIRVD